MSLRPTTAQLVADALSLPPGNTISGQPVPLVSVVATVLERQRQIEAVHAYWRLAEAIGEFHFCQERQQQIARLRAANGEATDLRTARAVATAQLREAEVQIATAQHDLAEILLLAPATPLPLPEDRPLTGPYRTLFAELFAGKKTPDRARILDQTLPLRNRAVESHAAALLAAEDALDAAIELQASGQEHLAGVLAALDAHVRQQRAFLAAVCRYNHDIADYALAVVSPQTTPDLLAGTLIKQDRPAGQPVTPLPTTATLPTSYLQPGGPIVAAGGSTGVSPAIPNWPTRAVRPVGAAGQTAESAPPVPARRNGTARGACGGGACRSATRQRARGTPPGPTAGIGHSTATGKADGPTLAAHRCEIERRPHDPFQPEADQREWPPASAALETYADFVSLTPADRAIQLTAVLFGDRDPQSAAGQQAGLSAGKMPALV